MGIQQLLAAEKKSAEKVAEARKSKLCVVMCHFAGHMIAQHGNIADVVHTVK